MKRRMISIMTLFAVCLTLLPTQALAAGGTADTGLCPHHTEDCGCLAPAEGQPCGYVCRICPIEDLITALPWAVTEDNVEQVRGQLDEILDLYRELTWEEQEQLDLSRCWELQAELDAANDPAPVLDEVSYQTCDTEGKNWTTETVTDYTEVTAETTTWNTGWYVVTDTVEIPGRVTVSGEVHLILADGCSLTTGGITVEPNNSLSIYAQSEGENMGSLTANGSGDAAGIGGSARSKNGGSITIYGGHIIAQGGDSNGSGIGSGNVASGGTIAIHGGNVEATGGGYYGAGIGGYNADGTTILITGGIVTAKGGYPLYDTKGTLNHTGGILNGAGGCTVTFVTSDQSVTIPIQTISEGAKAAQPEVESWILTFFMDEGYTTPFDFSSPINESITIYVRCEQNTDYIATVNGTNYTSVTGFVDAIENASGEVTATLLQNVDLGDTGSSPGLTVPRGVTLTLDCCEFTLTCSGAQVILVNGTLNFMGGTIRNSEQRNAVGISNNGTFHMSGGTVVNMSAEMKAVDADRNSTVTISGGTVEGGGLGLGMSAAERTNATLSGGTYSSLHAGYYRIADGNTTVSRPISEILAEGYALQGADGQFIPGSATGRQENVTIVECTHPGQTTDLGDGTHGAEGEGSTCIYCGTVITPESHTPDANNICSDCGAVLTVKVDIGGTASYYTTIETAWVAAKGKTATVTLLADVTANAPLTMEGGDVTFDGGAYTLTIKLTETSAYAITVNSGKLTMQGGTITSKGIVSNGVKAAGGTFVFTGGKIEASDNGINAAGGTVQISGGGTSSSTGLFYSGDGSVQISGGTFAGTRHAVYHYTGKVSSLLGHTGTTRYAYYLNGVPVTEGLDGKSLSAGTYEVKPCTTHVYQEESYTHTTGSTKHTQTCAACGAVEEVDCCYEIIQSADTNLCVCGASLTASAVNADNLVYNGQAQKPTASFMVDGVTPVEVKVIYTYTGNTNAGTGTLMVNPVGSTFSGMLAVPFTIAKATPVVTWNGGAAQTLTYTGQPAAVTADVTLVNSETGTVSYSYADQGSDNYTSGLPTDAGTYSVKASFAEQQNYHPADAELTLTIDPLEITVTPDRGQRKEYGAADPELTYKTAPSLIGDDELTGALAYEGTGVGTYPIIQGTLAAPFGNYTLNFISGVIFEITKPSLENAAVTLSQTSYTYDGAAHTPAVTVVKNGQTLTAGSDYTVAYTDNVNAGTATVTVTGIGNYEGTNSVDFTIQRKALIVTGAAAADRAYDGTNVVTVTGVTLDGIAENDDVSVDISNLTGTISGTDAGDYAAVTLPAMTLTGTAAGNYTLTQPTGAVSTNVTIERAPSSTLTPKTGELAVANKRAHTYTYGLGALRPDAPEGMSLGSRPVTYSLGTIMLTGGYYTSGAEVSGTALKLPIQAVESETADSIGTITVTIRTGNFEDMTAVINVRSVNKIIPEGEPTLSADAITYGQSVGTITLTGSMKDGTTDVPGTFAWSSPNNRPAVNSAYEAAWTFTPADNDTYAIVTGVSVIAVEPAPITDAVITLSRTAFRYDGGEHTPSITGVRLGDTTLTVGADYTAEIPTGTEAKTYTVTITGRGNYTGTATITFTINPVETSGEFVEDGTTMRLEVETGLSTVPAALEGSENFNTPEKIETALRTAVEKIMSNVGENIEVFDVTLQYKDGGEWKDVDPEHFPENGVTVVLPYPDGTGANPSGYTFTVQHLISSGDRAGEMETMPYTLTGDGLQCKFMSLSPVAIGYQAVTKPAPTPENPPAAKSGSSGGGSSHTSRSDRYTITVKNPAHGTVSADRTTASDGTTITLTVTPDSGYELDYLTVTDSKGNDIHVTEKNGKFTFTMPGRAVTVEAWFVQPAAVDEHLANCPSRAFYDLDADQWYHEAVDFVLERGLMSGTGSGFAQNAQLSRAMLAQILWNHAGKPSAAVRSSFPDTAAGEWYTGAVDWAAAQGIVSGYSDGRFGPNDSITREQLAVMLWRYAGSPAGNGQLPFTDAADAGSYALDALRWAVGDGILSGRGGNRLDPTGSATRAEAAQMLYHFIDQ